MSTPHNFRTIRSWRGSQDQAFEELCYQLRDPTPPGAALIKTGSPDGGLEWYFRFSNGVQWGWQAKYVFDIESLLKLMEKSLRTVVSKRPECRRLTFCIPFDLPDAPGGRERKSARQKYEDRKASWRRRIAGADRVRIELWSEGELLDRLTSHPAQRGKTWFFWEKEVFSVDWCERRLAITLQAAGERYSPELHVELPVAFALEGLAGTEPFWSRYRTRRGAVIKAADRLEVSRYKGLGVTSQLRDFERRLREWREAVIEESAPPDRLPRESHNEMSRALQASANAAYPDDPPKRKRTPTDRQNRDDERRRWLQHEVRQLGYATERFREFLDTPAAHAAERGALLLTGEAGQGKTHLMCDVGERAVRAGRPAAVLLGGRFAGRQVWSDIAEQLGLGQLGSETLIGGMRAAAEASNTPFLFFIDALNEAADPTAWQAELPALLAEIGQDPWVVLGVSIRSTFLPIVLPPAGLGDGIAEVEHLGFSGREVEATERFFDFFGLEQPRVPLLTPEFTNPLFLKLYCEGLKGLGLRAPPAGEAHVSDVFERYLRWKGERIVRQLALDPAERLVERAIDAFSAALGEASSEHLPRDAASTITNQFTPALHGWPNTMLGELLNEGLLTRDVAWDRHAHEYIDVVRFSYQRFADHRVVSALLDPYDSETALRAALAPRTPLRERVRFAPAGWIEALTVQLPERFGIELFDAARWRFKNEYQREVWDRALVQSIVARRPDAITTRSRELLSRAQHRSPVLIEHVLETLLAVAPNPEHPLNANMLHRRLMEFSLPVRDVAWSMPTYFAFNSEGPLDRLIRWAARGPYPDCPDDVLELAAVPLVWTFTSPHRLLRDYTTKALTRLLASRLPVLQALVSRFRGVNDPYVIERLAVLAHGAILIGGSEAPNAARDLARELKECALTSEQVPNILSRDAVRGAFEWCLRHGQIEQSEYETVKPPYGSAPAERPRTKKQLERAYDRYKKDRRTGDFLPSEYGSLFSSLFELGDFGTYVVEPKMSHFSRRRLSGASPLGALRRADPKVQYPRGFAPRWIFERVLSLGWRPDYFAAFDRHHGRDANRSSHKPERFGKKYQWIALRELVARTADNFHMTGDYGDDELRTYEGPWQFYARDIDPTLPPPPRYRDEEEDLRLGPTWPAEPSDAWWTPPGPHYSRHDPPPPDDWAANTGDIPSFEPLVRKQGPDGSRWVVLQAYYNWDDEEREDEDRYARNRRDLWSHIYSWVVQPTDRERLVDYLERHSLMGRWMPEARELTDGAYLAEMPWAEATDEYPDTWQELWPRGGQEPIQLSVYPAWVQYLWEGNVWDCSLSDSARAMLPAPLLFQAWDLRWVPGSRDWRAADGSIVAQYREAKDDRHSALLVREDRLKRALDQSGWSLVVGWLGEKQLLSRGLTGGLVRGWTQIDGIASLTGSTWAFGDRRLEYQRRD